MTVHVRQHPTARSLAATLMDSLSHGFSLDQAAEAIASDDLPIEFTRRLAAELSHHKLFALLQQWDSLLRSRNWILNVYATLDAAAGHAAAVARTREIGRDDFMSAYYYANRPVVIEGLAADWPAAHKWSSAYLQQACGHADVEVMTCRSGVAEERRSTSKEIRRRVRFRDYINYVFSGIDCDDQYLVARNLFFSNPATSVLLDDIRCPPLVQISELAEDLRCWMGPGGTHTGLHYDPANTLFVQISGTKTFELYAPWACVAMNQVGPWYATLRATDERTAAVTPRPVCKTVELRPGDALFIPVGWWHAVTALTPSISLNFFNFGVGNKFPEW